MDSSVTVASRFLVAVIVHRRSIDQTGLCSVSPSSRRLGDEPSVSLSTRRTSRPRQSRVSSVASGRNVWWGTARRRSCYRRLRGIASPQRAVEWRLL